MMFRDLPPEIQSHIFELCPPGDLAVLSRVHTSVRDMAEYALYSHIQYSVRPSDLIIGSQELKQDGSLLHTLANNSQKALMVKMLYVVLVDEYDEENGTHSMKADFILVKLAEVLVKLSHLVDLRILHGQWMNDSDVLFKGTQRISEVIRGDYFKLHTLYLRYNHYLEGIVADQPHLRLLGILSDNRAPRIEELLQRLSRRRTMPTVISLADLLWPTVTMFPAFLHPGEALRACREIATSLTNCHGWFGLDGYQLSISLLGISEENIGLVGELMEAMVTCLRDCCPQASTHNIHFSVIIHETSTQKPWRFPEFINPLALFEGVTILKVVYAEINFQECLQMAADLERCMVNTLGRTWPSLQEIRFFCMRPYLMMSRESNWNVIEGTSMDDEVDLN